MFVYETKCIIDENPVHALIFKSSPNGQQLPYQDGEEDTSFVIFTLPTESIYDQGAVYKEDSVVPAPIPWDQIPEEMLEQAVELLASTHLFAYQGIEKFVIDDEDTVLAKGVIFRRATSQMECRSAEPGDGILVIASEIFNWETQEWEKVSPQILVGIVDTD